MRIIVALLICLLALTAFAATNPPMKPFAGEKYGYTIDYPAGWRVYDHNDGVVVFKTETSRSAYPITVNIQTIFTKAADGSYADVKALMDDFVTQAPKHADQVKFLERKPIILLMPDDKKIAGEEAMMTFSDQGKNVKQWQVMVMSGDGKLFQAWAYRATEDEFGENLALAKEILYSWVLK